MDGKVDKHNSGIIVTIKARPLVLQNYGEYLELVFNIIAAGVAPRKWRH